MAVDKENPYRLQSCNRRRQRLRSAEAVAGNLPSGLPAAAQCTARNCQFHGIRRFIAPLIAIGNRSHHRFVIRFGRADAMPTRMRTITFIILASVAILGGSHNSSAQTTVVPVQNTLNSTDRKFIQTTGQGLIFEVLGGGLARIRTGTPDVRRFGVRMIVDHGQDYNELLALGASLGVPVPTVTDPTHAKVLQRFSTLVGTAFNKAYINYEIQDHITDIHDYLNEVRNGRNPQVRAFAASHLVELYAHLQFANNIAIANRLKK